MDVQSTEGSRFTGPDEQQIEGRGSGSVLTHRYPNTGSAEPNSSDGLEPHRDNNERPPSIGLGPSGDTVGGSERTREKSRIQAYFSQWTIERAVSLICIFFCLAEYIRLVYHNAYIPFKFTIRMQYNQISYAAAGILLICASVRKLALVLRHPEQMPVQPKGVWLPFCAYLAVIVLCQAIVVPIVRMTGDEDLVWHLEFWGFGMFKAAYRNLTYTYFLQALIIPGL